MLCDFFWCWNEFGDYELVFVVYECVDVYGWCVVWCLFVVWLLNVVECVEFFV